MIGIIDYGVGNLFSLKSSFEHIGTKAFVSSDVEQLRSADGLILPGVGAFSDAISKLTKTGLDVFVRQQSANGKPLMGICLGMQLLFEKSFEYGEHNGLGLLKGQVVPMQDSIPQELKIPHIGWNSLKFTQDNCPLFKNITDGDFVYFVHSYYADDCNDSLLATTEYGRVLTAAVAKDNIYGCQFHPEKSGDTGLKILRAFSDICNENM